VSEVCLLVSVNYLCENILGVETHIGRKNNFFECFDNFSGYFWHDGKY